MAWCCQATSHYLNQCWPRTLLRNGVPGPQCVNPFFFNIYWNVVCFLLHIHRAWHIPLPDSLGQVKLPVGQVDLSKVFFYILYEQIKKMWNIGNQAIRIFRLLPALMFALGWFRWWYLKILFYGDFFGLTWFYFTLDMLLKQHRYWEMLFSWYNYQKNINICGKYIHKDRRHSVIRSLS